MTESVGKLQGCAKTKSMHCAGTTCFGDCVITIQGLSTYCSSFADVGPRSNPMVTKVHVRLHSALSAAVHGTKETASSSFMAPACDVNVQGLLGKCGGAAAQ